MGKYKSIILAILFAAACFLSGPRFWQRREESLRPQQNEHIVSSAPLDYSAHILNNFAVENGTSIKPGIIPVAGITSHHLPTAESFIAKLYSGLSALSPKAENFLIVGPDHFEHCANLGSVTGKDYLTPFGLLKNNSEITKTLVDAGASEDDSCFSNEHSIGVQAAFIKKFFPNAKVAGLIFSSAAGDELANKLSAALAKEYPNTIVIASIDFSHYQSAKTANLIDSRTEKQIQTMNPQSLSLSQMDSPASLKFTIFYAEKLKAAPQWLLHANSYEFTGKADNTTGYFNVIFGK